MKLIHKFDKKITILFLLSLPILDMMTSLFKGAAIEPGIMVKGLFILFIIIRYKGISNFRKFCFSIGVTTILFIQSYSGGNFDLNLFKLNLVGFFKYFYFIAVLLWMKQLSSDMQSNTVKKILYIWSVIIISSFYLSWITNSYYRTYPWLLSTKSWYYAGNEISALLMVLFPISITYVLLEKSKLIKVFFMISCVVISSFIGTKTVYFGLLLYLICCLVYLIVTEVIKKRFQINFILVLCSTLLMLSLYPISPVGSQIEDHSNIISDSNTSSDDLEGSNNKLNNNQQNTGNQSIDDSSDLQYDNIFVNYPSIDFLNKILKNRLGRVYENFQLYASGTAFNYIFGVGTYVYSNNQLMQIQTEMDFFTVLFRYGIVGVAFLLYILYKIIRQIFKKILYSPDTNRLDILTDLFAIVLLICAAFFAGHVIISPLVNIMFPVIWMKNSLERNISYGK